MSRTSIVFKQAYNRCVAVLADSDRLPSEPELGQELGVSRTTVRAVLRRLDEARLIQWDKRTKLRLRIPCAEDFFPPEEIDSPADIVERSFMRRILKEGVAAGSHVSELDLARESGVGTTSVREFLIRFSRFGLIEKRPNGKWLLKGFTREFALELADVRQMFELRSATAFISLGSSSTAWTMLDRLDTEHRALAKTVESRYRDFPELDERFHRLIHNASCNRFIIDFYDVIAMIFHYHYQWNKAGERERIAAAIAEHAGYIDALKSRNPARVQAACLAHLTSARTTLLNSLPSS